MVVVRRVIVPDGSAVEVIEGEYAEGDSAAGHTNVEFVIKNKTGTAPIYLGDEDVISSEGFEWAVADGPLEWRLGPGERLFAILADGAADQEVHVLGRTIG